ncbi:hypothetical protein [Desulfobotulus mexicanus]|nr:hypothetical protein [Desulfobotulus mexicanus]
MTEGKNNGSRATDHTAPCPAEGIEGSKEWRQGRGTGESSKGYAGRGQEDRKLIRLTHTMMQKETLPWKTGSLCRPTQSHRMARIGINGHNPQDRLHPLKSEQKAK